MTIESQSELDVQESLAWVIAMSIGLIILGVVAILMPGIASSFFASMMGLIGLISGIVMIIESFQAIPVRGLWLNLSMGFLYITASMYILFNVETAMQALTLGFGILFIAEGILTVILAVLNRAGRQLAWLVSVNGITTLILGILILNHWPFDTIWLIGVYVGVSLLMNGLTLLIAAIAVRHVLTS